MKSVFSPLLSTLLLTSLITISNPAAADETRHGNKAQAAITKLAKSLGGIKSLLKLKNQRVLSRTERFERLQAFKPGASSPALGTIHRELISDLSAQRYRAHWTVDSSYPITTTYDYTEIIDDTQGAVIGRDGFAFPSREVPMLATRLGARVKQYLMTSPIKLVRHALRHRSELRYLGKQHYREYEAHVVSMPAWDQPIRLFIDTDSHELLKADTLEEDTIYGDALWEIKFDNWDEVDDVRLPYRLTSILDGHIIGKEVRESIELNVATTKATFLVAENLQRALNQEQFAWGIRFSQWFNRLLSAGIPIDIDQRNADTVNINPIASGVYHILAASHHSLLIEMRDYLVIADPVLYSERSETILAELKKKWPNKPVEYVIVSHFHNDHSGGLRAYAAIGATFIIGEETKDFYQAVLDAPHKIFADSYAKNPLDIKFIEVEDDEPYFLSDGQRRIRIFDVPNRHSIGMLVPYVEDVKLIFTADLYNPGLASPIPALFSFWAFDLYDTLINKEFPIEQIAGVHGGVASYSQFLADVEASR